MDKPKFHLGLPESVIKNTIQFMLLCLINCTSHFTFEMAVLNFNLKYF